MGEKDDGLGLSLSLKCSENYPPPPPPPLTVVAGSNGATATRFPLNLLPSPPLSFAQQRHHVATNHQKLSFIINHAAPSSSSVLPPGKYKFQCM